MMSEVSLAFSVKAYSLILLPFVKEADAVTHIPLDDQYFFDRFEN